MFRGGRLALVAVAAALCWPAAASATTVTMGDPIVPATSGKNQECQPCTSSFTLAQSFSPDTDFAPAAGRITSWRVTGEGTVELRVIEAGPEGGWLGVGTSAAATDLAGKPNATSLPIGAGDMIGVDFPASSSLSGIGWDASASDEILLWAPALANDGVERAPDAHEENRLLLNAEVVLAPIVSSISPASGSTAGGSAVKISGLYLDEATGVTFGSTPASSFSVDSSSQITAIAPLSAASTVDVRVTGVGGSSAVGTADRYAFTAPTTTSKPLGPELGPALVPVQPTVSGFVQSASRWRQGRSLPRISSADGTPLGTTFSFSLNEPATASFAFTRRVSGRRAGGRCVAVGHGNVGKPKCKRIVSAGSPLSFSGHPGLNTLRFQGRLSSFKTLKPGAYRVAISARDSRGLHSAPQSLSFTIVPG
jgi:hypothetical protein